MDAKIGEERLVELIEKERKLEELLSTYPELLEERRPTPAARRYKNALSTLIAKVEDVLKNDSFKGIFQVAYIHGCKYTGPNLAKALAEAKKVIK